MQSGVCFRCGQPGHWFRDCPLTTPSPLLPHPADSPPPIHCSCGGGLCLTKVSRTAKNPGRRFYKCPAAEGCGFFMWCDKVSDQQIQSRHVSAPPICPCGSGPCRRATVKSGPDLGRVYFVCSIKENFGACGFFQWEDAHTPSEHEEALSSSPCSTLVGVSDFCTVDEKDPIREVEADLLPDEVNRVNQEADETPCISSDKLEKDYPVSVGLNEDRVVEESNLSYSRFENVDPNCNVMLASGIFWQLERMSPKSVATDSMIQGNQVVGFCVNGWLGRLAFPPFRSLKAPTLMPVLCRVFPSLDHTAACKDAVRSEAEEQVLRSLSPEYVKTEERSLKALCGDQPMDGALLECDGKETSSATKRSCYALGADEVTSDLSSIIPSELGVVLCEENNRSLISSDSSAKHEPNPNSSESGPSLLDLIEQYNREKVRFDSVSLRHFKALADFKGSYGQLKSLHGKADHLRKLLVETEKQLACCKAETLEFAASFEEVLGELAESQKRMQTTAETLAKEIEVFKWRESEFAAPKRTS